MKIILNYPKYAAMGFPQRLKNEFETTVVNEPSECEVLLYLRMDMRDRLNK